MQTQIAQMSRQQLLAHIKQLTDIEGQHQQLAGLKSQLEQLNHQRADGFYLHCIGLVLVGCNDVAKGLEVISQAEQCDRFTPMMAQAQQEARNGQTQQAIKTCEYVDKQQPNHPKATFMLAQLSARQGLLERSCEYLRRGLEYSPYHLNLLNMLLGLYAQLHHYEWALDISTRMVKLLPEDLRLSLMHAETLVNCGRSEQALVAFEQAAILGAQQGAEPAQIKINQGHIYRTLGNTDSAINCYLDCLDSNQYFGSAYWSLANISKFSFSPEHIKQLESSQLNPDVDQAQSCQAGFALAHYHESQQQFKQAFMTYQGANFNRPGSHFNSEKHASLFNAIIASFDLACFESASFESASFESASVERDVKQPTDSVRPIFIVGLPRSGSTLIEQILASHSLVEGTSELKTLPSIAKRVYQHSCMLNKDNSGNLSKFSNQELARFGQMYFEETKMYRTDKPYFIDKLPPNFHHIGLIKLILPDAIVIDARRQPMACGLGIFRQYFAQGHDFAYNLNHIGFYYNQYLKLMDHWDSVLPKFVLCVQYEQLLAQFEPVVKQILDHCGLPFEAQCLSFYQTERAVYTASSDQVRQPLNSAGLELWQHYQQQLAPLKKALTESTVQRFKMWL